LVAGTGHSVHYETATLSGGCFWGLQEMLRQIPGVVKTTVGYTGGRVPDPTYAMVSSGKTGHVEAVEVTFDPTRLSYEQLLTDFLTERNPTRFSDNPESSGRSAIFYHSADQQRVAVLVKQKENQSGKWRLPVTTEIKAATRFYVAEDYHQDYYRKNFQPGTCSLN
jgi:methionine-S-sulfoxide reductase